jgi:predicted O-methyltransferase YrrM
MSASGFAFVSSPDLTALVREGYATARQRAGADGSKNPYALLPDTLEFLSVLLDRLSPKLIVEFGSGESTRLFAAWAATHGARISSVEHDRGWVDEIRARLDDRQRAVTRIVHSPLSVQLRGLRTFLTYRSLREIASEVVNADLLLLDGPHPSGREVVLYHVLTRCKVGATIVIDDANHYSIRDMLRGIPSPLAGCFAGEPIEDNSHGLFVLRCVHPPTAAEIPTIDLRAIARSYWRCLRDFRQHGTGA